MDGSNERKDQVVSAGFVPHLLHAMTAFPTKTDVCKNACGSIWHIAVDSDGARKNLLSSAGAIEELVKVVVMLCVSYHYILVIHPSIHPSMHPSNSSCQCTL